MIRESSSSATALSELALNAKALQDYVVNVAAGFKRLTDQAQWVEYSLTHLRWAQELAVELGLPLRLWPEQTLDPHASSRDEREWVAAWRQRPTPEPIGDGPACTDPYPPLPARQSVVDHYRTE